MTRTRRRTGGFTLLEVMVSVSVMAIALTIILNIITNNVKSTNRAKALTAATFLARAKIIEIEDRVLYQGFGDIDQNDGGDFGDQGYPDFTWTSLVERVELPTDASQQLQKVTTDTQMQPGTSSNPLAMMGGFLGGFMSTLIDPIRVGLQESVRRVTVTVSWTEGQKVQTFDVVSFMTDPSKLDMALQAGNMPDTSGQQPPGAGGASGQKGPSTGGGPQTPGGPPPPGGRR